jgi:hypothetical protein
MLVLKRTEGDWISIRHRSGDLIMIRTYDIAGPIETARGRSPGRVNVACHDPARNFEIERIRWFDPGRQIRPLDPANAQGAHER